MSKENYFFKKQQKEQEHSRKVVQKKIKKTLAILIPILLIAGGLIFWVGKSNNSSNVSTGAKIEVSPKEYDAGTVSMAAGVVKKDYEIKNVGTGDLKINDIWTSCHCTTAILKVAGKESPKFGMDHAGFWSQVLAPGQTAQLEVIFDPAFHGPQGTGPAVREIYLSTNDPQNKTASVMLTANVNP